MTMLFWRQRHHSGKIGVFAGCWIGVLVMDVVFALG